MIPVERILGLTGLAPLALLWGVAAGAWIAYRLFLRRISLRRHESMRRRFALLLRLLVLVSVLRAGCEALPPGSSAAYLSLATLVLCAVTVIRVAQAILYLLLFRAHMQVGVPRLVTNIFTLLLAVMVFGWIATDVLGFKLAPLLATSAIFSVVLGLALQDTLGNLFSGLALQVERPYAIGDWVEVQNGGERWTGQIQEISWRSTALLGFSDELISIPNRTIAQSQVVIFSQGQRPARRSQTFRLPLDAPVDAAKTALLEAVRDVPGVLSEPAPTVLLIEATESWLTIKVFYSIADFGAQYRAADRILAQALASLRRAGLSLANTKVVVITEKSSAG